MTRFLVAVMLFVGMAGLVSCGESNANKPGTIPVKAQPEDKMFFGMRGGMSVKQTQAIYPGEVVTDEKSGQQILNTKETQKILGDDYSVKFLFSKNRLIGAELKRIHSGEPEGLHGPWVANSAVYDRLKLELHRLYSSAYNVDESGDVKSTVWVSRGTNIHLLYYGFSDQDTALTLRYTEHETDYRL